jgi:hypothetical protein
VTLCAALLVAGAAGAANPGEDLERALEAREVGIKADLESETERALRHHKAAAEATAKVAECRGAIGSADARALSASERHRRLVECFDRQRANAALLAVNPE